MSISDHILDSRIDSTCILAGMGGTMRRDNATMLWVTILIGSFTALAIGVPLLALKPNEPGRYHEAAAFGFIGLGVVLFLSACGGLFNVYLETASRDVKWHFPFRRPITFPKEEAEESDILPPPFSPVPELRPITKHDIRSIPRHIGVKGLFADDPFLLFEFVVSNVSGRPVTLAGLEGRMTIAGTECLDPPFADRNLTIDGSEASAGFVYAIKQRLSLPLAIRLQENLETDIDVVPCVLTDLRYIAYTGDDNTAIEGCHVVTSRVYIRGPIPKDGEGVLFPLDSVFIHQDYWSIQGVRRYPTQKPQPPDEHLVILCNSFLAPADESLDLVLREVKSQCFKGGWPGLSAAYFQRYTEPLEHHSAAQLKAALNGGSSLEDAFLQSMEVYLRRVAFVRHCAHLGFFAETERIREWVDEDDGLQKQIGVLSGGRDRERLKNLLDSERERLAMPHEILAMRESP